MSDTTTRTEEAISKCLQKLRAESKQAVSDFLTTQESALDKLETKLKRRLGRLERVSAEQVKEIEEENRVLKKELKRMKKYEKENAELRSAVGRLETGREQVKTLLLGSVDEHQNTLDLVTVDAADTEMRKTDQPKQKKRKRSISLSVDLGGVRTRVSRSFSPAPQVTTPFTPCEDVSFATSSLRHETIEISAITALEELPTLDRMEGVVSPQN